MNAQAIAPEIMEVFAVTIFVSLMFAALFAALFLAERLQPRRRSLEQDALLPLDDPPAPVPAPARVPSSRSHP